MIEFKIDVISELARVGVNSTVAKNTGIFGQESFRKLRKGETSITMDNLNRLCYILNMQPGDIIRYVETAEDNEKYREKIPAKKTGH